MGIKYKYFIIFNKLFFITILKNLSKLKILASYPQIIQVIKDKYTDSSFLQNISLKLNLK